MITVQNKLVIEMEPNVNDICAVISAVSVFHPGKEIQLLEKIKSAVSDRIHNLQSAEDKNNI